MILSPHARILGRAALLVGSLAALSGACGKKGPPLAPLQPVPARIEDLAVRRLGDQVYLEFTIPTKNADMATPADLETVEAYGLTGEPVDRFNRPLDNRAFERYGTAVGSIEVQPPPPPADDGETQQPQPSPSRPAAPPPPPDPRPAQGERVTLVETITPAMATPFVHPGKGPKAQPKPPVSGPIAVPLVSRVERPVTRAYVAMGRSRKGRLGPLSNRVNLPMSPVPPTPPAPTVTYTATAITLQWVPPPDARLPIQPPPAPGELVARSLVPGPIPHTYNVYEHRTTGGPVAMPRPLNPQPLAAPGFQDPRVVFGTGRCYEVRTVEASGVVTVESPPSPPACVTFVDTFAPAAPRNLAAVGGEGAINLIWEPNEETDLAGYIVLRGEVGGSGLVPLMQAPIKETTYRDAAVSAGTRYVYAIVALDTATPPNYSVQSNPVEETAR